MDQGADLTKVGLRAQDIQTSLQDVELGPLGAEIKNVRLIGMAERLAIHIRGADVIDDYKKLEYVASQFAIDPLLLPSVVNVLQDLGWVRVEKHGGVVRKLEESVPYFSDIYSSCGQYFRDCGPSGIEEGIIAVCDALALSPTPEEALRDKLGLGDKEYGIIRDLGKAGGLIDQYSSPKTSEPVLYSPLYWIENPQQVEQAYLLIKRFGADRVYHALSRVRDYQGLPLASDGLDADPASLQEEMQIIREAIRRGIILAPAVDSFKGRRNFAFVPNIGIPVEEKVILEKAMAILACVRYGEHFGLITRIVHPQAILDTLVNPPHRIGSHTEIKKQYAILVGRGVGRVYPDKERTGRFYFQLVATDENKRAVRLARDLLKVGEMLEDKGLSKQLRDVLFYPGSYEEAARTVPRIRRPAAVSPKTQEAIFDILNSTMDKLRGA